MQKFRYVEKVLAIISLLLVIRTDLDLEYFIISEIIFFQKIFLNLSNFLLLFYFSEGEAPDLPNLVEECRNVHVGNAELCEKISKLVDDVKTMTVEVKELYLEVKVTLTSFADHDSCIVYISKSVLGRMR